MVLSALLAFGALPPAVAGATDDTFDAVVVGGPQAVSDEILEQLRGSTSGTVRRVHGTNRYETAAALSASAHQPGVPVVFVATGVDFPDALVAGPVAAGSGGPLLFVRPDSIPPSTRAELARLAPERVVVLGGDSVVSAAIAAELSIVSGAPVERLSGPDRFATAAAVSASHFSPGVPVAFVASGRAFPDALTASPSGGGQGGPVLLSETHHVPEATLGELARLRPQRIVALGGSAALSDLVLTQLRDVSTGSVERWGGNNRYETAVAVSSATYPVGSDTVYLVTGADYADALAVGPIAGAFGLSGLSTAAPSGGPGTGPVLLVPPGQALPAGTIGEIQRLRAGPPAPPPPARPVAVDQEVSTPFETPVGITLTATGVAASALTWEVVDQPDNGTLTGTAPNLTYTPDAGFDGTDTLTFTASRAALASNEATVTITVEPEPPTASDVSATTIQDQDVVITLDAAGTAGYPLAYSYTQPDNGTVTGDGPDVTYTPDPDFFDADDTFTFHVNDGFNDSNTATVTVTVDPAEPTAHDQSVAVDQDGSVEFTLTADNPTGGALTWSVVSGPSDGSLAGVAPDLTYTPDAGYFGADEFTFRVNDGFNDSNTATVDIAVDPLPPVAADVSAATDQGDPVVVTLDATSLTGEPLAYSYTQPDNGTVTGDGPDVTYTPDPDFHGDDEFDFQVNDGLNDSNTATVEIAVAPGVPVAHDQSASTPYETAVEITLTVDNPSAGDLTWLIVDDPEHGALTGEAPNLTYTPDDDFFGTDEFTFQVNDTHNDSDTATVTVTVAPPPPDADDQSVTTGQDDPVVITLTGTDHSGDGLTFAIDEGPANGTVELVGDEATYTPDADFHGEDTFTFVANDGYNDSAPATVTVTVTPAPPVADDTSATTAFEESVVIPLTGESFSGNPLTFAIADDPEHGTVAIDGDEATYTPDDDFFGSDEFTFVANDGHNDSDTATVTVTVAAPPPVADDQSVNVEQDTPTAITLGATNHSDNDLEYHYTQPANGTVTGDGPDVTYTSDPGYYGPDSFEFHVNDGFNDSNTAMVSISVDYVADPLAFDAVGNTPLEVGVVASGDPAVIEDGTLLDAVPGEFDWDGLDTTDTEGTVTANADGTFTYLPAAGFTGTDSFRYLLTNGTVSGSGLVEIEVGDVVWYVDDDADGSGDGRSPSPFATLAEAEADSGAGDIVFVYSGDYTDGIDLQASQQLLGEPYGLTVDGHALVAAGGTRPTIDAGAGDAIGLASGAEVHEIDVIGATGRGLVALNAGGTATVEDVDVSGATGDAVRATGAGAITLTDVDITNTGGNAVAVDGLTGSLAHSGTITQSGAVAAVAIANLGSSATVALDEIVSAASGITVSASGGQVTIASAQLGSSGSRISSASALEVSGGDGTVTLGSLTGWTQGAAGIDLDATGTVVISGGTVNTQGGAAIWADDVDTDITLATATSSGSAGTGLSLVDVTGTVDIAAGSITSATGNAVHVSGGSVDLTSATPVTNTAGRAVLVENLSGGLVRLTGAVAETGTGISLLSNTGSTIEFTGGLTVSTSGNDAFVATGGGSVVVTGASNTLAATSGRGLVVQNTLIGASGMRFRSVAATDATNGIVLTATGANALVVSGDGSTNRNGTGGTISDMSGHGVALSNANAVSLRNMTLEDNGGSGLHAQDTSGLSLVAADVQGNATSDGDVAGVMLLDVTGTVSLDHTRVNASAMRNVELLNNSGAVDVSMAEVDIRANVGVATGLLIRTYNAATATVAVTDSTIAEMTSDAIRAFSHNNSQITVSVTDSTFTGNDSAITFVPWDDATMYSTFANNNVTAPVGGFRSITVSSHDASTHHAIVEDNTIDGTGMRILAENGTLITRVEGNALTNIRSSEALRAESRGEGGGTSFLHLEFLNNSLTAAAGNTFGFSLEARNAGWACAQIAGNSPAGGGDALDSLFVGQFNTSTFEVEEIAVGANNATQMRAHLTAENPGAAGVDASGTFTGVAAGTCLRPSH